MISIPIRSCMKKFEMYVSVKVSGVKRFRVRLKLGALLIKLAGIIIGMKTIIEIKENINGGDL